MEELRLEKMMIVDDNEVKTKVTNRGNLSYRRITNSVSVYNRGIDVLKSALQKYVRRAQFDMVAYTIKEIYLFFQLAENDNEKKTGRAIITNLINRLIVILHEEVLFVEVNRYLLCMEYIQKFEESLRLDLRYLLLISKIISHSRICRRNSYLRSYFSDKEWPELNQPSLSKEEIYANFVSCFEKKSDNLYYWMFLLFYRGDTCETRRFRRKEYIYIIWEYLFSLPKVSESKTIQKALDFKLKEFFKVDRKERFMFLTSAIDVCLYYESSSDVEPHILRSGYDALLSTLEKQVHVDNFSFVEYDDYVYCMHTLEGLRRGKTVQDFKKEGVLCVNEDVEFLNEEWKAFYVSFFRSKKSKVKKNPYRDIVERLATEYVDLKEEEITICDYRRVGGKVPCFEFQNRILKQGRESMNYNVDYLLFQDLKRIFGLNFLDMKIVKSNKTLIMTENNSFVLQDTPCYYTSMEKVEGVMLQDMTEFLHKNQLLMLEYSKIGLVRGIFSVSDFNRRNVFIRSDFSLISLDEHDMGGKRNSIFNMKSSDVLHFFQERPDLLHDLCMELHRVDFNECKSRMQMFQMNESVIQDAEFNFKNIKTLVEKEMYGKKRKREE